MSSITQYKTSYIFIHFLKVSYDGGWTQATRGCGRVPHFFLACCSACFVLDILQISSGCIAPTCFTLVTGLVTPCSLVVEYRVSEYLSACSIWAVWNFSRLVPDYTASHARRLILVVTGLRTWRPTAFFGMRPIQNDLPHWLALSPLLFSFPLECFTGKDQGNWEGV
jgi:hypothetical protein